MLTPVQTLTLGYDRSQTVSYPKLMLLTPFRLQTLEALWDSLASFCHNKYLFSKLRSKLCSSLYYSKIYPGYQKLLVPIKTKISWIFTKVEQDTQVTIDIKSISHTSYVCLLVFLIASFCYLKLIKYFNRCYLINN